MTSAPQKVASTLHIIVFDSFHRRATVTALEGGLSFSEAGLAGTDAWCIVLLDEIKSGRVRSGFMAMALEHGMSVKGPGDSSK